VLKTKGEDGVSLIPLPGLEFVRINVKLAADERRLYDSVFEVSKERFSEAVQSHHRSLGVSAWIGTVSTRLLTCVLIALKIPYDCDLLSLLTRLRQLALHPSLIPENYLDVRDFAEYVGVQWSHCFSYI
jgi:SWI/SNF-related matrix-associated actin-dependent regulator of chromatin subfamily A3